MNKEHLITFGLVVAGVLVALKINSALNSISVLPPMTEETKS